MASAAIVFIKRKDIWMKNSFLISTAEMLGSNPRLKSAFFFFFQIPKLFRIEGLVEGVYQLRSILNFANPSISMKQNAIFLLDISFLITSLIIRLTPDFYGSD